MPNKTLQARLDRFIHTPQTELALILLILLSVILVIAEVTLDSQGQAYKLVYLTQELLTGIFIIELTIRYFAAKNKRHATHPRSDQDRDARTVLAALTIEKLHPGIYTCAQLLDGKNNVQLRVAGVEDVIVADELASHLMATSVRNWGSVDVLAELLTVQMGNQIYKIPLPQQWNGISFWNAAQWLKEELESILVAVERQTQRHRETLVNPPKNEQLLLGDRLVVIARHQPQIEKILQSKKP